MRRLIIFLAGIGLLLGLTVSRVGIASADAPTTCVYVPDAGHNIHGVFLQFYQSHNGAVNFGPPLTEAFIEDGLIVQYFQNARFEFHPDNPDPYRVLLGLLGMQFNIVDPPIKSSVIPAASNTNFRYFQDTGQMIGFTMKDYFDSHGGVDVLGYPVSMLRFESGNFVQYFQRTRLEYNPADPSASAVKTSPVGQMTLDKKYPSNFQWRARVANDWCPYIGVPQNVVPTPQPDGQPTPVPPNTVLSPQVHVRFRQTGLTGPQYVDITVDDQNGRPFAGAALSAVVHFASGDRAFPLMSTDATGKSSFGFDIGNQPANSTTVVEVTATAGSLTSTGRDSFTR